METQKNTTNIVFIGSEEVVPGVMNANSNMKMSLRVGMDCNVRIGQIVIISIRMFSLASFKNSAGILLAPLVIF